MYWIEQMEMQRLFKKTYLFTFHISLPCPLHFTDSFSPHI
jgi:hypothetical protein